MKTISVAGDPTTMSTIMVPKTDTPLYHEHETVTLHSSEGNEAVQKTIFRIVDAGDDQWELQFE
ncbi:hypothetical protein A0256_21170 [Mucilaginibacter sp. PAMC 26640]|nr:hypothetical protein A0256_21170 [Mucilaginibacter sp. PAMC 26640]